jgi:hypothetical protein
MKPATSDSVPQIHRLRLGPYVVSAVARVVHRTATVGCGLIAIHSLIAIGVLVNLPRSQV